MPRGLSGSTESPIHLGLGRILSLVCSDLSPWDEMVHLRKSHVMPPPPPTLMVTFLACIHAWCLDGIVGCGCSYTQCSAQVVLELQVDCHGCSVGHYMHHKKG